MSGWARFKNFKSDRSGAERLGRAIQACRQTGAFDDELSAESRLVILEAARSGRSADALPVLFTPTRRMILAGALPLMLAAGLLLVIERSAPPPGHSSGSAPTVQVSKQGDRVFFTIANGHRRHTVYRSTVPDRFEPRTAVEVRDGAYADRLADRDSLVFYRIE